MAATIEGFAAWIAIVLVVTLVEGDPDPKPILVNYFGVPASQYPSEVYRYDPRAVDYGRYTQTAEGYPLLNHGGRYLLAARPSNHGGYVTQEYEEEEPHVTARYEHERRDGYENPSTVTVRPLPHNNRAYFNEPINYQSKEFNGAPTPYYSSYNGIVRRAGIDENGRDFHGEPGTYAIRGGVFPAPEYEQAEHRNGYYRAPSGGEFNAYYRRDEPTYYSYDKPRFFGYSTQIHNRGDTENPNLDKAEYISESYDSKKDGYNPQKQQPERIIYNGNKIHRKVPVRGIDTKESQVFYPAKRNEQEPESGRYNN